MQLLPPWPAFDEPFFSRVRRQKIAPRHERRGACFTCQCYPARRRDSLLEQTDAARILLFNGGNNFFIEERPQFYRTMIYANEKRVIIVCIKRCNGDRLLQRGLERGIFIDAWLCTINIFFRYIANLIFIKRRFRGMQTFA